MALDSLQQKPSSNKQKRTGKIVESVKKLLMKIYMKTKKTISLYVEEIVIIVRNNAEQSIRKKMSSL